MLLCSCLQAAYFSVLNARVNNALTNGQQTVELWSSSDGNPSGCLDRSMLLLLILNNWTWKLYISDGPTWCLRLKTEAQYVSSQICPRTQRGMYAFSFRLDDYKFRESELIIFFCALAKFVLSQSEFQNCSLWREKLQNNSRILLFEYFTAITSITSIRSHRYNSHDLMQYFLSLCY